MNNLAKLAVAGSLVFSATMGLTEMFSRENGSQISMEERAAYSVLAGGMAMAILPLFYCRIEDRNEDTYKKL